MSQRHLSFSLLTVERPVKIGVPAVREGVLVVLPRVVDVEVAPVVEAIKERIDGVQSTANTAQSMADTAVAKANAAQSTANNAMPKSGGTFTGNVAAYGSNRNGGNIRNIEPCNSGWGGVSTNKIITLRK